MKGWMKALVWIACILGLVFGILRIWFIAFQRIPEDMNDTRNWANAPNLEPGDFVLVWRGGEAHVGDLVRCIDPGDPTRWLVARVVALGGEKVEMVDGLLLVNNFRTRVNGCHGEPRAITTPEGVEGSLACQDEELGSSHHDIYTPGPLAQLAPVVVEPGKLFLLSDNRNESYANDSRAHGTFAIEACQQRLVVRLWSKKGWSDSTRRMSFLF